MVSDFVPIVMRVSRGGISRERMSVCLWHVQKGLTLGYGQSSVLDYDRFFESVLRGVG